MIRVKITISVFRLTITGPSQCHSLQHCSCCTPYIQYLHCLNYPLYLGSQGPGSRWFPGVAPGNLSHRGLGQAECSPCGEFSIPGPHRTVSKGPRGPMATGHHWLGSVSRNNSTCRVHSRCREQEERRAKFLCGLKGLPRAIKAIGKRLPRSPMKT